MKLADIFRLARHFIKLVISLPIACVIIAGVCLILTPPIFQANAALFTNSDTALAGGFVQNEAVKYSQNGIEVSLSIDSAHMTILIAAKGSGYGGCIAAANVTVLATADDLRNANGQTLVTTNEATSVAPISLGFFRTLFLALIIGSLCVTCFFAIFDLVRTPIKSKENVEESCGLSVIGTIPSRDRGERLLANIRFRYYSTMGYPKKSLIRGFA